MSDSPLRRLAPGMTPIIMHIEHTGGTTLRQVIERQYATRERYEIYTPRFRQVEAYMALPEAERRRYRLILGHLNYGLHRHVPGESRYLTVLRHPVDRMIASYTYLARKVTARQYETYKENAVSWERHLENRRDWMRQLVQIVGGDDDQIRTWRIKDLPDGALATAIAHLESDFAMVGLQDRYDESLLMMRHVLGWQKPIHYVRQNTTTRRVRLADLSAADRALIETLAEVELPLYEYAVRRFEAQRSAYPGDIERDVAAFKQENERYAAARARVERFKAPLRAVKRAIRKLRGALQ
jgi:hypothetical protein